MRKIFIIGIVVGILMIFASFVVWFSFDTSKAEKVKGVEFERRWSETSVYTDEDGVKREWKNWYADVRYKGKLYNKVILATEFTSEDDYFYLYDGDLYSDELVMGANNTAFVPLLISGFIVTVVSFVGLMV